MKEVYQMFFSPTHTSATIADAIGEALTAEPRTVVDLTYRVEREISVENGIAVIAVPVYGGRVAETAKKRLKSIRGVHSEAVVVVLYGNRDYEDALLELCDLAAEQGFRPIAAAAFIGEHSFSRKDRPITAKRPDLSDIEIAHRFGKEIAARIADGNCERQVVPKGNFPYKVKEKSTPQTPLTVEELCVQCEHCITICPTESIRLGSKIVSDPQTCIKCCACVKECPLEARVFDTPYTDLLYRNFSERKQPELFF